MGFNSVPPRWEEYSKIGKLIPGTQIIPFKTPLRKEICRNLNDLNLRFTIEDLIEECKEKKLTMVIDLTQTTRFYKSEELEKYGISYKKMSVKGNGIMPSESEVSKFCQLIDRHVKETGEAAVVGVHCTHGLNRTGYFICRYMIDYLGMLGETSVTLFETSRGHQFDRDNYRSFLINRTPSVGTQSQSSSIDPLPINDCRLLLSSSGSRDNRHENRKGKSSEKDVSYNSKTRNINEIDLYNDHHRDQCQSYHDYRKSKSNFNNNSFSSIDNNRLSPSSNDSRGHENWKRKYSEEETNCIHNRRDRRECDSYRDHPAEQSQSYRDYKKYKSSRDNHSDNYSQSSSRHYRS